MSTGTRTPGIFARIGPTLAAIGRAFRRGAIAVLALSAMAPAAAMAENVRVYAAASLTAAVTVLADAYAAAGLGQLTAVTGSSGALANQIVQGAPADVYLSANRDWVDFLIDNGAVVADAVVVFAGNRLVVIAPPDSTLNAGDGGAAALAEALDGLRLAWGDPAVAPVGVYARQAVTALGLWPALQPNLVFAQDANATVAFVARDAVDAGIVYATDARGADVRVITTLPETAHDPIRYFAAPVVGGNAAGAAAFLAMLHGEIGGGVLAELGFTAPDTPQ